MRSEALQLRMVTIASCLPTQYRPCQQCFAPQRNQTLRIEVPRMNGPQSHVIEWRLTIRMDVGLRRRETKPPYPNHRPSPRFTEGAALPSLDPLAGQLALAHVWMSRPPANAQFSHDVSLKQTITFSVSIPA